MSSSLWGDGALPRQTPLTVCCALVTSAARSGPPGPTHRALCAPARGGVGGTAGSWEGGSGDASQGSGPAQARAPTLPAGASLEGRGPGSAHPLKNRRLDSLFTRPRHKTTGSLCVPPPHTAVGSRDIILIINGDPSHREDSKLCVPVPSSPGAYFISDSCFGCFY